MRKSLSVAFLAVAFAVTAAAAPKIEGTTTLQRFNPVGATSHHQQFDLFFTTSHHEYTCRTSTKQSVNATDFVAGSDLAYDIDGNKAKLKTIRGKHVDCTIVRVKDLSAMQQ
ncbi:MAG TPA: hypothetical protein VHX63_01930 [Acidobacteriaceae bacterium]|jgi:hypothetical protein|nr:hypothetical protein [Acidobacteriaceae bacterium]